MTEKRGDIQGLRGIAVLAVVAYHASHVLLPGGFAGVDIFFVISGYVITQVLLRRLDGDAFSLRDFYQRRIRRLFPALYVVLFATLVAGLVILPPKGLKEEVYTQFFTTLFLSNFAFAHLAGYFDADAGLKPLLHTWSLAVEEQFYLVYPLVLLALHRFARRYLWIILAILAAASLAAAELVLRTRPDAAFYLPASRAFELLAGALCVVIPTMSDSLKRRLSVAGLAMLVLSLIFVRDTLPWPGLLTLLPVVGAACLLVTSGAWGNRLLAWPPLVAIGDMSYSLYLWHWPALVYARLVFGDHLWVSLPVLALAFGLAWLSWRHIEQPWLRGSRPVWLPAALVMTLSIVSALAIYGLNGLPQRFNAPQRAAFAASDDFNHDRKHCHLAPRGRIDYGATCVFGDRSVAPSLAVWGDSEGAELSLALGQRLAGQHRSVRQITASACPPALGYRIAYSPSCDAHNADMLHHLEADPMITAVVLTLNYQRYAGADPAAMMAGLEQSVVALQAAGKTVIILYPVPVYDFDPPSQAGLALRLGRDPRGIGMTLAQYQADNARTLAELDAFTKAHNIAALRPADVLCDPAFCHVFRPDLGVLYFNAQHLGVTGAGLLADRMLAYSTLSK